MLQPIVFDKDKIDEITNRLLPSPGKILTTAKRDAIVLSLTTEITGLMVPVDQKEAVFSSSSLSDSLDAAIPAPRSILSKVTRPALQNDIAMLVQAEFAAHNEQLEKEAEAERMRQMAAKTTLELKPYENSYPPVRGKVMAVLIVAAIVAMIVAFTLAKR